MKEAMSRADTLPSAWLDPALAKAVSLQDEAWRKMLFDVGKTCTQEARKARPEMETILNQFESCLPATMLPLDNATILRAAEDPAIQEDEGGYNVPDLSLL